ncbi:MAG: hypothetical protein J0H68_09315 [Sphingobacteriia bacterium]|nr:hypothetical protein [Sphingobacteriia bacterium]
MFKTLSLFLCILIIGNCSDHSSKNINEKFLERSIVLGKTTKNEIEALFGKPNEINKDISEGSEYWSYQVQDENPGLFDSLLKNLPSNSHKIVQFSFNDNNLVVHYTILKAIKDEKWPKPPAGSSFKYRFKHKDF